MRIFVLALVYVMCVAPHLPAFGQAAGMDRRHLRVPVRIDEGSVLTDLLLEVDVADYGIPIDRFGDTVSLPSERAFGQLIDALSAGNAQEAGGYHQPVPFTEVDAVNLANAYANAFADGWGAATVTHRISLGIEDLYLWQMPLEGRLIPRAFRIAANGEAPFWREEPATAGMQALKTVITEAALLGIDSTAFADPNGNLDRTYRRQVPGTSATWCFDGLSVDWNAFDETAAIPDHPAATFYANACAALKSGDAQAYGSQFSPTSGQRFLEWANEMGTERYAAFVEDSVSQGRRVVFLLDASPATLVFYLTSDNRLLYETIYRDPDTNTFQLVSFYMYGLFDNLLKDVDFFQRPVLIPISGGDENTLSLGARDPEPLVSGGDEEEEEPQAERVSEPESAAPTTTDQPESQAPTAITKTGSAWLVAVLIGLLVVGLIALVLYLIQRQQ